MQSSPTADRNGTGEGAPARKTTPPPGRNLGDGRQRLVTKRKAI